jgi:hypothetical protein
MPPITNSMMTKSWKMTFQSLRIAAIETPPSKISNPALLIADIDVNMPCHNAVQK